MIIFDIETEPQEREAVERTLPEELRNPVMPENIDKPIEPDWQAECPDYGLKKESDAYENRFAEQWTEAKIAKAASKIEVISQKRADKIKAMKDEWQTKMNAAREKWKADIEAKRNKAFADAALDAKTGRVRMVVIRDTFTDDVLALVWETDNDRISQILADEITYKTEGDGATIKKAVDVRFFATEGAMIKAAIDEISQRMENERIIEEATAMIGYYIKDFDLPFMFRRLWMNGIPHRVKWKRGRYWTDEVIDLHEEFAFADRSYKVGGLDGLAEMLKCGISKLGDGASFADWYARNPVEGIAYGVNDVAETEACARKMGIV